MKDFVISMLYVNFVVYINVCTKFVVKKKQKNFTVRSKINYYNRLTIANQLNTKTGLWRNSDVLTDNLKVPTFYLKYIRVSFNNDIKI